MDIIKEYEEKIKIMLAPLGIIAKKANGTSRKYVDVDVNAFIEIKTLFMKTFVSYDDAKLNQAINNIIPTLYVIED